MKITFSYLHRSCVRISLLRVPEKNLLFYLFLSLRFSISIALLPESRHFSISFSFFYIGDTYKIGIFERAGNDFHRRWKKRIVLEIKEFG